MMRLLLTFSLVAGVLAQAWGQSSAVRYDNATKAITAPIPFRVGQSAVDPTAPGNGSIWYDTATDTLNARINGATVNLGAASTITGADTQVLFFDGANTPAGDPGMTYNKTTNSLTLTGGFGLSGNGTFNGDVSFDGDIDLTPEGGVITIAPHTGGSGAINNMVIGGGTPLAGTFTALNATSIGTIPGTGAFTTLSASGATTLTAGAASTTVATGTLIVTGGVGVSGQVTSATQATSGFASWGSGSAGSPGYGGLTVWNSGQIGFMAGGTVLAGSANDAFFTRGGAAATLQMGANAATGINQKLKAMDASAGTGGNLTLAAGLGTTAGGQLIFQTAVNTAGGYVDAAKLDNSTTATHTRFFLYDVDNATLERVTVGAADTGGAGFKVLRIPN